MNLNSRFSFCLIIKNEENNLRKCLDPIKKLNAEIVIVDTGSTDNSLSIAREYTDCIYPFEWINDFSAARNFAMEKASNNHVFFLDADEFTENINLDKINEYFKYYPDSIGRITRRNKCVSGDGTCIFTDPVERLFDKRFYKYTGAIHEQVTRKDNKPLEGFMLDWTVYHEGYMGTPEQLKKKGMRNAELLFKELEKNGDDPYVYYQLGQSYGLFEDYENSLKYYEKAVNLSPDTSLEYVEMTITNYGHALTNNNRAQEAALLETKYPCYMNNSDFVVMLAIANTKTGNLIKAVNLYDTAVLCTKGYTEGTSSFTAYHNKACILAALGNYKDADYYFKKAGSDTAESRKSKEYAVLAMPNISLVIDVCPGKPDLLHIFLKGLKFQTLGISYAEYIFVINENDSQSRKILDDFEKEYPENVILFIESEYNEASEDNLFKRLAGGYTCCSTEYVMFLTSEYYLLPDTLRLLARCKNNGFPDFITYVIDKHSAEIAETPDKLIKLHESDQLELKLFMLELAENNNRNLLKQGNYLAEPLFRGLYKRDFLEKTGLPVNSTVYEAEMIYIIENICSILLS